MEKLVSHSELKDNHIGVKGSNNRRKYDYIITEQLEYEYYKHYRESRKIARRLNTGNTAC